MAPRSLCYARLQEGRNAEIRCPPRARPARGSRRSRRRVLRSPDRAGAGELPHLGRRAPPLPRPHQGVRDGQARGRARELRLRAVRQEDPEGDRGRLRGDHRGQAPRRVPPRRLPGRRRHLDEHERERGDREPRPRADGEEEGRLRGLRPARPRELLAVHERRLSDLAPRRDGARQRPARRRDEGAHRGVPGEGEGVRAHPQDGPDPASGRRPDDARPGVQRLRRDARGRGPRTRADPERPLRDEHGGDGDRHGPERSRGLRREVHEAPREGHRVPDPRSRRTSSRRRRTRRPTSSTRPA